MESFRIANLPILIMINSLRSSDENEARLAERLTHIYNSSILSNKELDMSFVPGEISQFWAQVQETRQLMSSSKDNMETDTKIQNQIKEEDKENKKKKKKGNTRKQEHKIVSSTNALEERKENRSKILKISVRKSGEWEWRDREV